MSDRLNAQTASLGLLILPTARLPRAGRPRNFAASCPPPRLRTTHRSGSNECLVIGAEAASLLQHDMLAHDRDGSFASILPHLGHVRLAPHSNRIADIVFRPVGARTGLMHRSTARAEKTASRRSLRNHPLLRLGGCEISRAIPRPTTSPPGEKATARQHQTRKSCACDGTRDRSYALGGNKSARAERARKGEMVHIRYEIDRASCKNVKTVK
jgi:hypothetical protein